MLLRKYGKCIFPLVLVAVCIIGSQPRSRDDCRNVPPGTILPIVSRSYRLLHRDTHLLLRNRRKYTFATHPREALLLSFMKQNLHTHTTYCDGQNSVAELIHAALEKGFGVLGFSGHGYTSYDESYCMTREETEQYIREVRKAKEFFTKDPEGAARYFAPEVTDPEPLRIYLGIEADLYTDQPFTRAEQGLFSPGVKGGTFDYIIGSTHAFRLAWDELADMGIHREGLTDPGIGGILFREEGIYITVDYGLEVNDWAIDRLFSGDPMTLAEYYFRDEGTVVDATDCDIVGHFDLLVKFNEQKPYFDEAAPRYIAAWKAALENIFRSFRAKDRDPIFEINTGAMAKGYRTKPYPSLEILKEIRDMGGRVIINSDCHKAEMLDFAFGEAGGLAEEAGITCISIE